ncbi:kinesin-domain-containing protein [Gonapodya prolifera JEL478]|uniref:Kinesin-like protein n=1 Tax=Gonapodya prolifera (strain JEL478) TaxID=1344416 RepID=A0A139AFE8_GONPJ|nr:kinesin-domain-containing protein [Gonapodya prolifera JEL478]|eukprot:KXS15145.1 kinesin-domain-containing protein [Gonapodya prolifera JEL478]
MNSSYGSGVGPQRNIRVVLRTRPTAEFAGDIIKLQPGGKSVNIHIPKDPTGEGGHINNKQENWDFRFDNVYHNVGQETLYDECAAPLVKGMFQGLNGTIMAYGQTGAGKTFTMAGATENYKHRGLIPRVISQVFKEISEKPQMAATVWVSYLEIYQEQIVDLLTTVDGAEDSTSALIVVDDKSGGASVRGLNLMIANNEEDALNYLFEGETNKSISEHQMNKVSSRSHCIFTLHIEARSRQENSEKVLYSKMNLVDLAGSERISKTQTTGTSLREAMYINKSLTFLEQVVIALADRRREHIPYRQSKLTNVLRDSLGGNCNTLVIACIWGERQHIEETVSTLRFASRMMCVTNTPTVNVQYDPMALIKKYEKEVKDLRQELAMHDTLANRSHAQYEPMSESQKFELQKQVKNYLDHDNEDLEIASLRQIKETYAQFRVLYKYLEAELEDLKRSGRDPRMHGGVLMPTTTQVLPVDKSSSTSLSVSASDTATTKAGALDLEKDEGVGELEGGFAIGLMPSSARPQPSKVGAKDIKSSDKIKKKPTKTDKRLGSNPTLSEPQSRQLNNDIPALAIETVLPSSPRASFPNDSTLLPTSLPPLSSKGTALSTRASNADQPVTLSPPPRSEEFESFKKGKGAETSKILTENKVALCEKRRLAKEAAEAVNETKREIDDVRDILERKSMELNAAVADTGNRIIDEEEHKLLDRLKFLKGQYRERYATLREARGEVDYCDRLVDQCRRKLIQEFEQHYAVTFGVASVGAGLVGEEDILDVAEKFEIMQLQRMSQEEAEPSAVTFFNARRKLKKRVT